MIEGLDEETIQGYKELRKEVAKGIGPEAIATANFMDQLELEKPHQSGAEGEQ